MIKQIRKGFTLIETVVVMVVLGILMVATVVGASSYINKANTSNTKGDLTGLSTIAKTVFYEVYNIDPPNAEAFLQGGKYENYFVGDMELVDNTSATDSIVFTKTVTDAWKQPYQVKFEKDKDISGVKGIENGKYDYAFTFTSGGKDKKIDGKDDIISIVAIKNAVVSSAFVEKAASEPSKPAPAPDPKPDLTPVLGTKYTQGDYEYAYNQYLFNSVWEDDTTQNGWGVKVLDETKTAYGEILSAIGGKPVTNMNWTFYNCQKLVTAPSIPNSVKNMRYTFWECRSLVTAPAIPNSVTNMDCTFYNCTSLITAPVISSSVTNMQSTFAYCTSLITAPVIPNSVTTMGNTFSGCVNLKTAPAIPNSVTNMDCTFYGCTSLVNAPTIPNSVTNMGGTFWNCTSLVTAPTIPNSVINMSNTFNYCPNLVTVPTISNSVVNMYYTFAYCSSLVTAQTIPSSVTQMSQTFLGCEDLAGDLTIKANPNYCTKTFSGAVTTGNLTIHCTTENKSIIDVMVSGNSNITVVADAK